LFPRGNRVPHEEPLQPIRNADCANLALGLLGLPPVPGVGATINALHDLAVTGTVPRNLPLTVTRVDGSIRLAWLNLGAEFHYTVEMRSGSAWEEGPGTWPITGTSWADPEPAEGTRIYRVSATAAPE
jgi:hypothetical protein